MELTARHPGSRLATHGALSGPLSDQVDDSLAVLVAQGCAAAGEELARRYRNRLVVFCRSLLVSSEDAEDAAQESLVRALGALPTYRPQGQFRAWIFAIAANICRREYRSRRREEQVSAPPEPEAAPTSDECLRGAMGAAVRRAVDRLPAIYRAPVVLFYLEEMPIAEIATVLTRSRAAVKIQLWRARALLARELAEWLD